MNIMTNSHLWRNVDKVINTQHMFEGGNKIACVRKKRF